MRLIAISVFCVLTLTGCSLTPAERAQLSQMLNESGDFAQDFSNQAAQTNRQMQNTRQPDPYIPPVYSNQPRTYLINTPQGQKRVQCFTTDMGLIKCY